MKHKFLSMALCLLAVLSLTTPASAAAPQAAPDTQELKTTGQTIADGSGSISDTLLTTKAIDGKELSRRDYSQDANPAIFNERWTRAMYNALRQTVIDRYRIIPGNNENRYNPYYSYANAIAKDYESRRTFQSVMSDISRLYIYRFDVETYAKDYYLYPEYFLVTVGITDYKLDKATLDTLDAAKNLTDSEKIILFNRFIHTRLTYDKKSAAGIEKVFTSTEPVKGACGTYANAFLYLCEMAGIPAISISGDNHAWAMVYLDGKWVHCDPTNSKNSEPFRETMRYAPYDAQRVAFSKEIVVPNSTQ